jgi:mannose-binding lectin 1
VDSLAFGHCEYSYRNLGRPSRIAVHQTKDNFRVDVDGHLCFESPKIRLPTGYQLGVTAASAENADSFEVFKFVVTTENMAPDDPSTNSNSNSNTKRDNIPATNAWGSSNNDPPADEAASSIPVDAQFADLHNRLQSMMKHISALNRDVSASQSQSLTRYSSLEDKISQLERQMNKLDSLSSIDRKLNEIQADVRQTKADIHNALDRQVAGLKNVVRDTHHTMLSRIPGTMGYVMVVVAGQGLTIVGYLVYKRRKSGGLKKYI